MGEITIRQPLVRNLSAARQKKKDNDALANLILTFFIGISLEQNFSPTKKQIVDKIAQFMRLVREL